MFRSNTSAAEAQMVRCKECGDTMNAIYSTEARDTCTPCGGEAKINAVDDSHELQRARKG